MKIMLFQMAFVFMLMTYLNILTCIHYHRTREGIDRNNWVSECMFICSQSKVLLLRVSTEHKTAGNLI